MYRSNYLIEQENKILEIFESLYKSEHRFSELALNGFHQRIIDEIKAFDNSINTKKYCLVHIACVNLGDKLQYAHLWFLYLLHDKNKEKDRVIEFLLFSDENNILAEPMSDVIFNFLIKEIGQSRNSFLKRYTKEIHADAFDCMKKIGMVLPAHNYHAHLDYAEKLIDLLNVSQTDNMLKIFGYMLFSYTFQRYIDYEEKFYFPILNIQISSKKYTALDIKAFLSVIHAIFAPKTKLPDETIFWSEDCSREDTIKSKFGNIEGGIIIADTSSARSWQKYEYLIKRYLKRRSAIEVPEKPDNEPYGMITMSSKNPVPEQTVNTTFSEYDKQMLIKTKRAHETLSKVVSKYIHYVDSQIETGNWYNIENFDFDTELLDNLADTIYYASVLDYRQCRAITPIVFTLNSFFDFMREKYNISSDIYDYFIGMTKSLYTQTHEDETISEKSAYASQLIIESVYLLYKTEGSFISEFFGDIPFIYPNSRKYNDLICFTTIQAIIDFVKDNAKYLNDHQRTKLNTLLLTDPDAVSEFDLKRYLTDNSLLVSNAKRHDYRIQNKLYIALNTEALAKQFNNI